MKDKLEKTFLELVEISEVYPKEKEIVKYLESFLTGLSLGYSYWLAHANLFRRPKQILFLLYMLLQLTVSSRLYLFCSNETRAWRAFLAA
ncbi:MAG: hypothetical protein ACQEP6_01710 [Patescibacteria group bacterium]